jgi:aspartate aminotransferase
VKFSERVLKLTPSVTLEITAKAKQMQAKGEDVVSFGAGEPDIDTPQPIKQACIRALEKGDTKYTPSAGTLALRKAISEKLKRENGLEYDPSAIVVSCGAKHSLYNLFQVILNPGDEVIIPAPYWLSYPEMVTLGGGTSVFIETSEAAGFVPSIDQIEKAVTPRTKAFILNSPSNPTGSVWSRKQLEDLAALAKRRKLLVVSDEIYEKLLYDGEKHVSIASLDPEIKKLTVTVNGMSKSYAMTGWRLGYLAAEKEIASLVDGLQSHSTSNPTSFDQAGGVESLNPSHESFVREMHSSFLKRRNLMMEELSKINKLSAFNPKGAFYVFVNVSKTGMDSIKLSEKLLTEAKVAVIPGAAFGAPNHIRLSFAISEQDIVKGIRRIAECLR